MTRKGFDRLQGQLEEMRDRTPFLQKAISEAREKGDLKENAEYHAARENLALHEAKIRDLEGRLSQAQIIKDDGLPKDEIVMGAIVVIRDAADGETEEYHLVGAGEDDPLHNRILTTSPMGRAMLNKKVGDRFTVQAPVGAMEFIVMEIRYDHE